MGNIFSLPAIPYQFWQRPREQTIKPFANSMGYSAIKKEAICKNKKGQDLDVCIADAIKLEPPAFGKEPSYQIAADLITLAVYFSLPEIKDRLRKLVSVDER